MSTLIPLEDLRIASPCRAEWGLMEGDDRTRFCQSCAKTVYNLSGMSKGEAEKLLMEKEGNLCVRFYQRADGTILTDNCPVGVKVVQRPFKWLAAGFVALLASGAAIAAREANVPGSANPVCAKPITIDSLRKVPVVGYVVNRFSPEPPPMTYVMGMVSITPPQQPVNGN